MYHHSVAGLPQKDMGYKKKYSLFSCLVMTTGITDHKKNMDMVLLIDNTRATIVISDIHNYNYAGSCLVSLSPEHYNLPLIVLNPVNMR